MGPSAPQLTPGLNSLQRNLSAQFSYQKGHTYGIFSPDFDLLLPFSYLPRLLPTHTHSCCLCPVPITPEAADVCDAHQISAVSPPQDMGTKRDRNPWVPGEAGEAAGRQIICPRATADLQTPNSSTRFSKGESV